MLTQIDLMDIICWAQFIGQQGNGKKAKIILNKRFYWMTLNHVYYVPLGQSLVFTNSNVERGLAYCRQAIDLDPNDCMVVSANYGYIG